MGKTEMKRVVRSKKSYAITCIWCRRTIVYRPLYLYISTEKGKHVNNRRITTPPIHLVHGHPLATEYVYGVIME